MGFHLKMKTLTSSLFVALTYVISYRVLAISIMTLLVT